MPVAETSAAVGAMVVLAHAVGPDMEVDLGAHFRCSHAGSSECMMIVSAYDLGRTGFVSRKDRSVERVLSSANILPHLPNGTVDVRLLCSLYRSTTAPKHLET